MKTIGPYQLAAFYVYGGLFGRENTFSYIVDDDGNYWKVVDTRVDQVSGNLLSLLVFQALKKLVRPR
jgi:hypothetical protein